jgi:hypothetical protein
MNLLDVASLATAHEPGHRRRLSDLMFDLGMASIAFDFPIRHVPPMEEFRGEDNVDQFVLLVTFTAFILRNMPIAFVDSPVAIEAVHAPVDISFVVKAHSPDQDIPLRLDMA